MGLSTNLISGLASGFDWRSMIDELMKIERRPVDLIEARKREYEEKLTEWQSFNTKLLSLKTAAGALKDSDDFSVFTSSMTSDSSTVAASDLLSLVTSSSASQGSFSIVVSDIATAQKLSSDSFISFSDALGSSYAGDILVNGRVVAISATDSLAEVRDRINNANSGINPTGVTASIVNYGTNNYRLILTSDSTGADGISLLNASGTDILGAFGFTETAPGSYEVKNVITGGAQSDRFTNVNATVAGLLGLSGPQASTQLEIKAIDGTSDPISINLATDNLYDIRDAINSAKGTTSLSASVVTETVDSTIYYMLQIDGIDNTDPDTFQDENNIFQTLGLIRGRVGDVLGVTGTKEMTTDGQIIDATTYLADIDGYLSVDNPNDTIAFSGTKVNGDPVTAAPFEITAGSTVQDLLIAIENAYEEFDGDVTASVTGDGKIQIVDNTTSEGSSLNVTLTSTITHGSLDFGITNQDAAIVRKREVIAGQDATILVDGIQVTSSDNAVEDVLPGVTLNLLKADEDTTITLNVNRDIDAVMEKVSAFVDAYNEVASYMRQQQTYDTEAETTGGVLFGDGTLSSVKLDLTSILVQSVWGVSSEFSILGLVGINLDNEGQLSINTDTLRGYLETNFNDVKYLFSANGTTSAGTLDYISHSRDTQAGEYTVNITQAATQSSSTSDTVSGTLGGDETLTITEGDKTATISLTSDMTITDIINAVNTELDTVYTEILVGDQKLYADDQGEGGGNYITSGTTWDSIYDSDGTLLDLEDEDIITFSGTSRTGAEIQGSYKMDDVSTDTVQGLLSAIEVAYGNQVSASIDSSGHIVITDKSEGNSQLSLTFDYSQTANHQDIFGTVLTTNPGGQEGRFALSITASNPFASGWTQLTYDDFESGWGSFTDGGGDCDLYTGGTYAHQGNNAATIQDGNDVASSFYHTDPIDVDAAGYTQIEIDFWFYADGMDNGDDFWVEYFDGSSWQTAASYVSGTDFNNGEFYHETVYVDEGPYTFPTDMKIRFQCSANHWGDDVYIDEVKVSGRISPALTLTHDSYGSDHSFTISETGNLLWSAGDQTVDNGQDVVGTINGEAATGLGQILTGDDEEANVDGLVIKYTGTATGDVGNIKLTLGTAELFDTALFNITDDYEGYAAFKQDSLQDRISDFDDQIEQMEARLSAKMENMINRFVAMEVALSKIQSQSQWLSGQISGLYGSWGWI